MHADWRTEAAAEARMREQMFARRVGYMVICSPKEDEEWDVTFVPDQERAAEEVRRLKAADPPQECSTVKPTMRAIKSWWTRQQRRMKDEEAG